MFIDEVFCMGDEEDAVLGTAIPKTIPIKFFDAYEAAKINQAELTASKPEAHAKTSDVTDVIAHTTRIVIRGIDYLIKEVHPDGTGIKVMLLTTDV